MGNLRGRLARSIQLPCRADICTGAFHGRIAQVGSGLFDKLEHVLHYFRVVLRNVLRFADIFDQVNAYAAGAPIHMINPEVWRAG